MTEPHQDFRTAFDDADSIIDHVYPPTVDAEPQVFVIAAAILLVGRDIATAISNVAAAIENHR